MVTGVDRRHHVVDDLEPVAVEFQFIRMGPELMALFVGPVAGPGSRGDHVGPDQSGRIGTIESNPLGRSGVATDGSTGGCGGDERATEDGEPHAEGDERTAEGDDGRHATSGVGRNEPATGRSRRNV
ncbi:hypothetical protein [Halorarum salinum]|uniref:Uncharacterized protein n=1 Tax=Halorarum salinum TaxID=2743089 RepID=A0A7D5L9M2_9EURY|nr:hypothetical protein [Halobaculum salinum]QLG61328.1 hypothetical protein HUG12_06095 [Halobaculum salinum]